MSIIDAIMGKNMAINELQESGSVGYVEPNKELVTIELTDGQSIDATRKEGVLEVGKTYTVTVGDEAYNCMCIDGSAFDCDAFLGNAGLIGGSDTGEPFIVAETFDGGLDNVWVLAAMSNNGACTISVYQPETIHPIDPKFLPNVDSVTLNSPGGKQFKLTVDDTGAIKATEVT